MKPIAPRPLPPTASHNETGGQSGTKRSPLALREGLRERFVLALASGALLILATAGAARAEDYWHAAQPLEPGEILQQGVVELRAEKHPPLGALTIGESPVGLEVRRRIAFGRVLTGRDVGRPTLVRGNTQVRVLWHSGPMSIEMEGRALENGSAGDEVRVLNTMTSRTIRGTVMADGTVEIPSGP
jgi:flagella basal body P-ring formation protein FlgA